MAGSANHDIPCGVDLGASDAIAFSLSSHGYEPVKFLGFLYESAWVPQIASQTSTPFLSSRKAI